MQNLFQHIKVKSLARIENEGMIFVVKGPDLIKEDYYRPIGGTVEYGETALAAVKREVMEELVTQIEVADEPLIIENLFICDGKFGHEIDYLYPARFADPRFYEVKPYRLLEADLSEFQALWVPVADCLSGKYRLVPERLLEWYRKQTD